MCCRASPAPIEFTRDLAEESVQRKAIEYDSTGDAHYDAASALIKSMRGSDPDAAIYWLARMLEAGEDVRFLARRIVIFASEDVGNADPQALPLAVAAMQACEFVGLPECQLNLAQAVTYLACAPKSNASTVAISEAKADVREGRLLPVPVILKRQSLQRREAARPRRGLRVLARQSGRGDRAGLPGRRAGVLSAGRAGIRERAGGSAREDSRDAPRGQAEAGKHGSHRVALTPCYQGASGTKGIEERVPRSGARTSVTRCLSPLVASNTDNKLSLPPAQR